MEQVFKHLNPTPDDQMPLVLFLLVVQYRCFFVFFRCLSRSLIEQVNPKLLQQQQGRIVRSTLRLREGIVAAIVIVAFICS